MEKLENLQLNHLERGFGLTLGNSIRRILLSSLQGAAITSVKIKVLFTNFQLLLVLKKI